SDGGAGRELVRDRPARCPSCITQSLLQRGRVDLDDDTIDLVPQLGALLFGLGNKRQQFVETLDRLAVRIHAKTRGGERVQRVALLGKEICAIDREGKVGIE